MNRTKIEYLDYTWNPIVGCEGIGCAVRKNCWATAMAKRQKQYCPLCYSFSPHVHWERFNQPLEVKKPSRIGVAFMGDFYDKGIAGNVRGSLYIRMEKASWHTFIILTKQPQNIDLDEGFPSNVYLGVTVNSEGDLWRIDSLKLTEARIKFISFEPLYGPICPKKLNLEGIDWIIIGGQTRPLLLPLPQWIDSLVEQAKRFSVPIFFKDNLPLGYVNKIGEEFPKC